MKKHIKTGQHIFRLVIIILFFISCIVFMLTVCSVGRTFAQQDSMSANNELHSNVELYPSESVQPSIEMQPAQPAPLPEPAQPASPIEPAQPVPGIDSIQPSGLPDFIPEADVQQLPAQYPAGPFDPGEAPKTSDSTDMALLLAGLGTGMILLRQVVFRGGNKGGGSVK